MEDILAVEQALVSQARADPACFAAIYDRFFARVLNYVRCRVPAREDADDLTVEIFQRAFTGLAGYRPEQAPFAAWLFAIARNTVNDHLRRTRIRRWFSLDVLREQVDPQPQPEEVALRRDRLSGVLEAVTRLDSRERDLISLKFAAGLTNRRIAELTGLSESHVGVILYRAVRRLREELQGGNR